MQRLELRDRFLEQLMPGLIDRNVCVDAHLSGGLDDRAEGDVPAESWIAYEPLGEKVHDFLCTSERFAPDDVGLSRECDHRLLSPR